MDKKTIIIIVVAVVLALGASFGAVWFITQKQDSDEPKQLDVHEQKRLEEKKLQEAMLTSNWEVFNLTLPCKHSPDGSLPVVKADLVFVVPIKYRLIIENNDGKLRDVIASVMRTTSAEDLGADADMSQLKSRISERAKADLGVEVQNILFLRFSYDSLPTRVR